MQKIIAILNVLVLVAILFIVAILSSGCAEKKIPLGKIVANQVECLEIIQCKEMAEKICDSKYELNSYFHKNGEYNIIFYCK
jgi:hypothetical protein